MKRLAATGLEKVVIGVSGGLDSTQAALVAVRAMDRLGLPRANVLAYTMPGFATSAPHVRQRARADGGARRVVRARSTSVRRRERMLEDIGHPYAQGKPRL